MRKKITIVGAGNVGASIAYTLTIDGMASEIVLIDINRGKAEGEAMDILQGTALCPPVDIHAGDYEDAAESDIILADAWDVATAGDVTAIPAEKQSVSIQIDNYGGAASSPLSIGYTLNFKGDSVAGTFNATTKTFTATV